MDILDALRGFPEKALPLIADDTGSQSNLSNQLTQDSASYPAQNNCDTSPFVCTMVLTLRGKCVVYSRTDENQETFRLFCS